MVLHLSLTPATEDQTFGIHDKTAHFHSSIPDMCINVDVCTFQHSKFLVYFISRI